MIEDEILYRVLVKMPGIFTNKGYNLCIISSRFGISIGVKYFFVKIPDNCRASEALRKQVNSGLKLLITKRLVLFKYENLNRFEINRFYAAFHGSQF